MEKDYILVDIYADSTGLFTEDFLDYRMKSNIVTIDIPREILFEFFKENCLEEFRTNENLSDEAFFEDWLGEYTCDDTEGLYQYVEQRGFSRIIDSVG